MNQRMNELEINLGQLGHLHTLSPKECSLTDITPVKSFERKILVPPLSDIRWNEARDPAETLPSLSSCPEIQLDDHSAAQWDS